MFVLRRTGRHVAPLASVLSTSLSTPYTTPLWQTAGLTLGGAAAQDRRHYTDTTREAVLGWSPVEAVVFTLDRLHQATQLPWWAMLSLTAITLRATMLPLTIKQIQATGPTMSCLSQAVRIVRAQKKSEKNEKWSLVDAKNVISKFQKIAKYSDTPHPAWMLCAPLIQIPAFLTCVIGIRRMCQQQWPGFTEGGILWFSDLTQSTVQFSEMTTQMGPIGAALPLAISVSYLLHIQLSFRKGHIAASATPPSSFFPYPFPVASILASTGQALSRLLKLGFEWLCVPILVVTLQLPQGALVYWLTSSLCSVTQSVLLGNSAVRRSLRLSKLQETSHHDILSRFTPQVMDLFIRAAEQRAKGSYEEAIGTLQRIVQVDPNNPRAHYALGQLLGEQQRWEDAASCYRSCLTYESDPQLLSKGFLGLGVAEFMKSDFESSERSLISSLKLDRSNVAGWMALCSLYKRMGDSDRAKAALQHAIDLDPNCKQWEKHL